MAESPPRPDLMQETAGSPRPIVDPAEGVARPLTRVEDPLPSDSRIDIMHDGPSDRPSASKRRKGSGEMGIAIPDTLEEGEAGEQAGTASELGTSRADEPGSGPLSSNPSVFRSQTSSRPPHPSSTGLQQRSTRSFFSQSQSHSFGQTQPSGNGLSGYERTIIHQASLVYDRVGRDDYKGASEMGGMLRIHFPISAFNPQTSSTGTYPHLLFIIPTILCALIHDPPERVKQIFHTLTKPITVDPIVIACYRLTMGLIRREEVWARLREIRGLVEMATRSDSRYDERFEGTVLKCLERFRDRYTVTQLETIRNAYELIPKKTFAVYLGLTSEESVLQLVQAVGWKSTTDGSQMIIPTREGKKGPVVSTLAELRKMTADTILLQRRL